jgi:hypothetical protein
MNSPGNLRIVGKATHKSKKGNGVRLMVFHNGKLVSSWKCFANSLQTILPLKVKKGDIVDLVADPMGSPNNDHYSWPVTFTLKSGSKRAKWRLADLFNSKPEKNFSIWASLAQVLMMSNEFLYVD